MTPLLPVLSPPYPDTYLRFYQSILTWPMGTWSSSSRTAGTRVMIWSAKRDR